MDFLKLSPRTSRLTHAITSIACHPGGKILVLQELSGTHIPCRACIQEKEAEWRGLHMPNFAFWTFNSLVRLLMPLLHPGGVSKEAKRGEAYHFMEIPPQRRTLKCLGHSLAMPIPCWFRKPSLLIPCLYVCISLRQLLVSSSTAFKSFNSNPDLLFKFFFILYQSIAN